MENEMIERVARAIRARKQVITGYDDEALARAAIEAMREPTEDMSAMPWASEILCPDGTVVQPELAAQVWRAMIDAALAEGQ